MSEATTIEIVPGQTLPDLVFQIPVQPTFSISGFVSNSDSAHLPAEVKVMLVSTSQPLLTLAYAEDVATNGTFAFRQVLPGEYWAIVTVDASGEPKWSTRKVRVDVEGNIASLPLELIRN